MKLTLVRHTRVDGKGICYGQTDMPLAASFVEEASVIKAKLGSLEQKNIIASPLARCTKLAEFLQHPFATDVRLKEISFGQWEGRAWSTLNQEEVIQWGDDWQNYTPPGGEPFASFKKRINSFLDSLTKEQETIVICHAGVIRLIACMANQSDIANMFAIQVDYGSIHHVAMTNC